MKVPAASMTSLSVSCQNSKRAMKMRRPVSSHTHKQTITPKISAPPGVDTPIARKPPMMIAAAPQAISDATSARSQLGIEAVEHRERVADPRRLKRGHQGERGVEDGVDAERGRTELVAHQHHNHETAQRDRDLVDDRACGVVGELLLVGAVELRAALAQGVGLGSRDGSVHGRSGRQALAPVRPAPPRDQASGRG